MNLNEIDLTSLPESNIFKWNPLLWEEWVYDKNKDMDIIHLPKSSKKIKAWWICTHCNNEVVMSLHAKFNNIRCDFCMGRKVNNTNSLQAKFPEIAKHINPEFHDASSIYYKSSNIKYNFLCSLCKRNFKSRVPHVIRAVEKSKTTGCPYCAGLIATPETSVLAKHPWIVKIWNKEMNKEINLFPENTTPYSRKYFYLNCYHCGSLDKKQVTTVKSLEYRCSYCRGLKINHTNNLKENHVDIALWDRNKNTVQPEDVYYRSKKKYWWYCKDCKHSHLQTPQHKQDNITHCPFCTNRKVKTGYNDLATRNPLVHSWLADKSEGYNISEFSHKKLEFICPSCNLNVGKKRVSDISGRLVVPCPECTTGISQPERMFRAILQELEVNFEREKMFPWLKNRRYDFFIIDKNAIVELHGGQHYLTKTSGLYSEEVIKNTQKNDILKREIAKKNGIGNYLEVNCSNAKPKDNYQAMCNALLQLGFPKKQIDKIDFFKVIENSFPTNKREMYQRLLNGESIEKLAKEYGYKKRSLEKLALRELKDFQN